MLLTACPNAAALAAADEAGKTEEPRSRVFLADTVEVTGERMPADPMRVAVAGSSIPASALDTRRQAGLDEGLDLVPGVLAQSRAGGGDVRILMRGFGARGNGDRSNAGTTRGIRVLLDGFPVTEPDGRTSLDLADVGGLSQIRVLRSNASTLYGSASGGVIDLVSDVAFEHPYAEGRIAGGSFGLQRAQGEIGTRAGSARILLTGAWTSFDGWREHSASEVAIGGLAIRSDPSPRTSIGLFLRAARNRFRMPGPLTEEQLAADPRQADSLYVARNDRRDNRIGRVGLRLRQALGSGESHSIVASAFVEPKTLQRSERGRFRDFERVHLGGNLLHSLAFTLGRSGAVPARWNAGFEEGYQDGSARFHDLGPGGTRGTTLVSDKREGIETQGFYTDLAVRPSGRLELVAGARYDRLRYIFEDYQDPSLGDERTLDALSPRLSVSYEAGRGQMFYAALSGGIEAPAFNEVDPPAPYDTLTGLNPFLDPATSVTYEIGTKGRIGGDSPAAPVRVRYDVAAYRIDLRDEIVPYDGGAYYLTAGKSRRYGFEAGIDAESRWGLSAKAALTVLSSEYLRYENELGDFDGNETSGIPGTTLTLLLRYDTRPGVYAEARLRTVGSYWADDANQVEVPGYERIDLTVGMERSIGGSRVVGIFAGIENLAGEDYVSSAFINGTGGRYFEPGMERNLVVGVSARTGLGAAD
ncbi:MAG: TonB-dependent receptor family protein [Candidatus Eisenbacteria bacterium]